MSAMLAVRCHTGGFNSENFEVHSNRKDRKAPPKRSLNQKHSLNRKRGAQSCLFLSKHQPFFYTTANGVKLCNAQNMTSSQLAQVKRRTRESAHPHSLLRHGDKAYGVYDGYDRKVAFRLLFENSNQLSSYGLHLASLEEDRLTKIRTFGATVTGTYHCVRTALNH